MKKRNHIKKISDYAMVGGLGAFLVIGLVGCSDSSNNNQQGQQNALTNAGNLQGAFVVIEALPNGGYTIVEEYPSSTMRVLLRGLDGSERILSKEEIDILVKEEAIKIDNGTSPLTNPEQVSSGGMGLGGVLLSSIAGAMIGSWIGNKLFNNQNFQNQKRTQYKSPQAYSRSVNAVNSAKSSARSSSAKKSGFFGNSSRSSTRTSRFGS